MRREHCGETGLEGSTHKLCHLLGLPAVPSHEQESHTKSKNVIESERSQGGEEVEDRESEGEEGTNECRQSSDDK